jgi:hypothetical protein
VTQATFDAELLLRIFVAHQYARRLNSAGSVVDVANQRVPLLTAAWDWDSGHGTTQLYASLTVAFEWQ